MKKGIFAAALAAVCTTALSAQTMSLAQALDACVRETARKLPAQTRIACPHINAVSVELADYVTNQLNLRLVRDSRFIVVNRDVLSNEAVDGERDYQLGGNVSDETVVSITQQLGATAVIAGTLRSAGRNYRLDIRVVLVETNQLVLQWYADVHAGDEWRKLAVAGAGLSFGSSVSLAEADKRTLLQDVQRGILNNQTPLLLPSTVREAVDPDKSRAFVIEVEYEERNGLMVGTASIAFTRDGLTLCISKEYYISEMGSKRFIQKAGEVLRDDAAFFKRVSEELVK
jgi:TolB-like protein